MIPIDFDINELAKKLSTQAVEGISSSDLPVGMKQVIPKAVYAFIKYTCESLQKDNNTYNEEQITLISKVIGMCICKTIIDNDTTKIPKEFWKHILKEIAVETIQITKQAVFQGQERKNILANVEKQRQMSYWKLLLKLNADKKIQLDLDTDGQNELLKLYIAVNLIKIFDPKSNSKYWSKLRATQERLTKETGFTIPYARIMDSYELKDFEYQILLRNVIIGTGKIYPDKFMVIKKQWESKNLPTPTNAIEDIDPTYSVSAYWIEDNSIPKDKGLTIIAPEDVIIQHLQAIIFNYVEYILTLDDVAQANENVRVSNPKAVEIIEKHLQLTDLKIIMCDLVKNNYSISKNMISLIYEKIAEYSQQTNNPTKIANKIKLFLDNLTNNNN